MKIEMLANKYIDTEIPHAALAEGGPDWETVKRMEYNAFIAGYQAALLENIDLIEDLKNELREFYYE